MHQLIICSSIDSVKSTHVAHCSTAITYASRISHERLPSRSLAHSSYFKPLKFPLLRFQKVCKLPAGGVVIISAGA
jgi:hypothetical protein